MHLSAFVDFANIFTWYRSKQSISELSLMANNVFSSSFFPIKKLSNSYGTKSQQKQFAQKLHCILFKFDTGFSSCCTFLTRIDSTGSWAATATYKTWSYKKKKRKKIKAYRKSLMKEHTVNRYLLILDLKSFRS